MVTENKKLNLSKGFKLCLAVEIVVLLINTVMLFVKPETVYVDGADVADTFSADLGECSKGAYLVRIEYQTDGSQNSCIVTGSDSSYKSLLTNVVALNPGQNSMEYVIYVLEKQPLTVNINYGGEGTLNINQIELIGTNIMARVALAINIFLCLLIDIFYWLYKKGKLGREQKEAIIVIVAGTVLSLLPVLTDYIIAGGDLTYHLQRIEGIADGLRAGQFPVRMYPEWLWGYGYADSIMYGNTLLYIPALLRIIGFTVQTSYKMFLFGITMGTMTIAYYCYKHMFKSHYIGLMASFLSVTVPYHYFANFGNAALGMTVSRMFFPFLIYGFYKIFTEDCKEKSYKRNWILPTIGLSGLIQSHVLSVELSGFFIIVTCIMLIRKVFQKETFLVLVKTVLFTMLLNAWFLIPFVDYMLSVDLHVNYVGARTIQDRGIYPAQLFLMSFRDGLTTMYGDNGMVGFQATSVGIILSSAIFVFTGLAWCSKKEERNQESNLLIRQGWKFAILGLLAMVMSTNLFPWDWIQKQNGLFQKMVSSLQFPTRLLEYAAVFLIALVCINVKVLLQGQNKRVLTTYVAIIVGLTIFTANNLAGDILYSRNFFRLYDDIDMGRGYISGEEYRLEKSSVDLMFQMQEPSCSDNVKMDWYEKDSLKVTMGCTNLSGTTGTVELPLTNYKGYKAYVKETGEKLAITFGQNERIKVEIPDGFDEEEVVIKFTGEWYWRVAEIVSLLCLISLILYHNRAVSGKFRKSIEMLVDNGSEQGE